jgi:hypothetical protein
MWFEWVGMKPTWAHAKRIDFFTHVRTHLFRRKELPLQPFSHQREHAQAFYLPPPPRAFVFAI